MECRLRWVVVLFSALLVTLHPGDPARAAEPIVQPAVDGILAAFATHPLVGLADRHDLANALEFYAAIVRDPRFATEVGNVVAEFGASQHQAILDRYLDGKDVPYAEIAKVWRDTVAWSPTVLGVGYQAFFAQVRAVNLSLPPERRIRVLLTEPPIQWSRIRTKEEWQRIYDTRDPHAADQIVRKILGPKKKALVIYGGAHFYSYPWPSIWPTPSGGTANLAEIVARTHPGAFYFVSIYGGHGKPECSIALEAEMKWPTGVLIAPIRGTPLEQTLMRPECTPPYQWLDPAIPAEESARLKKRLHEMDMGVAGDALLYLAPAAELVNTPVDPTTYMDEAYRKELGRRIRLRGNTPLSFAELIPFAATPPQRWTP